MSFEFSRSDIDHYLYLLAKEYKKLNKSDPEAELILVGGAATILNYNFREATTDLDSIIKASSSMKDAINKIEDDYNLPSSWLNDDFKKTSSYSPKLVEKSKFYKRFCNCLNVRTVAEEYLIAMKLHSLREYKHDYSDVLGIINDQYERGVKVNLSESRIKDAFFELYNTDLDHETAVYLHNVCEYPDIEELFYATKDNERRNMETLLNLKNDGVVLSEDVISKYVKPNKDLADNTSFNPTIFTSSDERIDNAIKRSNSYTSSDANIIENIDIYKR